MPSAFKGVIVTTDATADRPRLSVIIPAYNEEKYLGATLQNVQSAIDEHRRRTGAFAEIIVANNNSTDRTEDVASAYGAKVIFEGRNNIAAARNAGARAAQSEVLAFLDADDHISSNLLWLVDAAMTSSRYIGGGVARIFRDRRSIPILLHDKLMDLGKFLCGVSTGLIYTSVEAFGTMGGFDEQYYATEEFKFVMDLKALGKKESKQFCNLREGYVIKSARRFDHYGALRVWSNLLKANIPPRRLRDRKACSFWYDVGERK